MEYYDYEQDYQRFDQPFEVWEIVHDWFETNYVFVGYCYGTDEAADAERDGYYVIEVGGTYDTNYWY